MWHINMSHKIYGFLSQIVFEIDSHHQSIFSFLFFFLVNFGYFLVLTYPFSPCLHTEFLEFANS